MAVRIQRKRTAGWKMPENTVYVGRPTVWGNPWKIKAAIEYGSFKPEFAAQVCVDEYEAWLIGIRSPYGEHLGYWLTPEMRNQREQILARLPELKGKNLACWCSLDKPCHADILLRLANNPKMG